jgi:hypothetical protein
LYLTFHYHSLLSLIIHYIMHISPLIFLATLTTLSPVSAHGKVVVVQGDAGGNGTALGIIGGIVPGYGPNDETEIDTTVFKRVRIATDGLGKTTGDGDNKAGCLINTMMQSGSVLPQVSADNGSILGTFHIVTTVSDSFRGRKLGRRLSFIGWCWSHVSNDRYRRDWEIL